jgi:Flp pilus assembly protein TadB
MNETESGVLESTEERMKSVDRDFDSTKKTGYSQLLAAYYLLPVCAIAVLIKIGHEAYLHWFSFFVLFKLIALPILFVFPLMTTLRFVKYIKKALKEGLISERIANNCEYFIGNLLMTIYMTIMLFATWDGI